jgi:hypothetical protein
MRRTATLLALLLLAGCTSVRELDPETALSGKDLDSAVGLYGPWEQKLTRNGRPTFVWRRHLVEGDAHYYCEMSVEMGFRQTISHSYMLGFPRACELFNVRFESELK